MPRKLVKERKYHFIYKTTCSLTGKYYIGMHSTDNLDDGYLGSGKRLRYSIRKYGVENHTREILEYCSSREELVNREAEIVNLNEIAKEECMNLKIGGSGGLGFISVEQQRHRSICGGKATALKLKTDDKFRKQHNLRASNSFKKMHIEGKIRYDTFKGKTHNEESKEKIGKANSIKQSGSRNSQHGSMWITNGKENKKIKKENKIPEGWTKGRILKQNNSSSD